MKEWIIMTDTDGTYIQTIYHGGDNSLGVRYRPPHPVPGYDDG